MGLGRGDPHEDPGHAESWGLVSASSLRGPWTTQEAYEASQVGRSEEERRAAKLRFGETEKQRGEREFHEGLAFFTSCGVEQLRPSSRSVKTQGGTRPYGMVASRRGGPQQGVQRPGIGEMELRPSSSRVQRTYSNPFLSQVMDQDRTQNGGFFTGSIRAAGKLNVA
mmetsp:Transcript_3830/g.8946  ORF Transcript_3830/g.8946 Transcript_3830/m.8946 type:complete len:167 (+) Transcript_3830:3-503(+)